MERDQIRAIPASMKMRGCVRVGAGKFLLLHHLLGVESCKSCNSFTPPKTMRSRMMSCILIIRAGVMTLGACLQGIGQSETAQGWSHVDLNCAFTCSGSTYRRLH